MTTRVTLADLTTHTGCGDRTARRLVREGKLPGFMDGSHWICSPGEWQEWLDGTWQYRGVPSSPVRKRNERPALLHRVKQDAA